MNVGASADFFPEAVMAARLFALGEVRTDGLGLWVPPVRRGSTEGVTAALTRPL